MKAIKAPQPPTNYKGVHSFIGLCNFFWSYIKIFVTISAPLSKLTKDSGYNGGQLPTDALNSFLELKKRLMTDPVVAFSRLD